MVRQSKQEERRSVSRKRPTFHTSQIRGKGPGKQVKSKKLRENPLLVPNAVNSNSFFVEKIKKHGV